MKLLSNNYKTNNKIVKLNILPVYKNSNYKTFRNSKINKIELSKKIYI
jgi:hypothetical protein